ncbi:MAG: ApeI family dehydratase [Pseudoalteromonas prydzensis]|uniref:Thioester dehydrase n=2 Tax=root TaxID=1 RepID=A0A7V1D142_9GAMM|nr:thioester dehydrase [Pseudoalteromonas prydzensis]HEA17996.1 thioester dehydrase [Pseudoalteromonas prydzensis]
MQSLNNTQPDVTVLSHSADKVSLALYISEDIDYFRGHFPDAPILAGVVQLDWAVKFAQQYLAFPAIVQDVEVLKFQVVTTVNMTVNLTLERNKNGKCIFSYHSDKGQHASGRLVFASQPL